MSETEKPSCHDILTTIQSELKAPKGQYNKFGKYSYRSCEDILEAVKPLLKKNGATLYLTDNVMSQEDRVYVVATAVFCFGREEIRVDAYAREPLIKKGFDESQITGAASSYARKYALNGLFLIDDTKDADTMNNSDHGLSDDVKDQIDRINDIQSLTDFYNRTVTAENKKELTALCASRKQWILNGNS